MLEARKAVSQDRSTKRAAPGIVSFGVANFLFCVLYTVLAIDAAYGLVVAGCAIISMASVVISRRYWTRWADELDDRLISARLTGRPARHFLVTGRGKVRLAIVTVMLLLVFGDAWSENVASIAFDHDWWLLRVPILTALAGGFVCCEAVFGLCLHDGQAPKLRAAGPGR